MLTNISYEIWDFKKCLKYVKILLKDKPRNFDKLVIAWVCYENLNEMDNCISSYKKALEIQPYNKEIKEKIKKIEK